MLGCNRYDEEHVLVLPDDQCYTIVRSCFGCHSTCLDVIQMLVCEVFKCMIMQINILGTDAYCVCTQIVYALHLRGVHLVVGGFLWVKNLVDGFNMMISWVKCLWLTIHRLKLKHLRNKQCWTTQKLLKISKLA